MLAKTACATPNYFALDRGLRPNVEDAQKVKVVLRRLFEQWREAVLELNVEETTFLPYGFFDQGTEWLSCTRIHAGFSLVQGWSNVEDYSFDPSAIGAYLRQLEDLHSNGPRIEVTTEELLDAIDASLSHAT